LRRSYPEREDTLRVDDLELDPRSRDVVRSGCVVELTRTEFAVLELLMRNSGIVLTRDTIRERVWGFDDSYGSTTLDVYVGYLRRKTEAGGETRMIHTVRGVGFVPVTLRTRVTLAAGIAILVAVLGLSIAVHMVVRANLRDQIDESLRNSVPEEHRVTPETLTSTAPQHVPLIHEAYMQLVDRAGDVVAAFDDRPLPVPAVVLEVARGERQDAFFDADVDGTSVRVYVTSAGWEGAGGRPVADRSRARSAPALPGLGRHLSRCGGFGRPDRASRCGRRDDTGPPGRRSSRVRRQNR